MSPFRKITQQLCALDLKSPDLEDFATPIVAPPDLWPRTKTPMGFASCAGRPLVRSNSLCLRPSPSTMDINAIHALHRTVKSYNEQLRNRATVSNIAAGAENESAAEATFQSLPVHLNDPATDIAFTEGHFSNANGLNANISNDILTLQLIDLDDVDMEQMNKGSQIPSSHTAVPSSFNTRYTTHIDSELDADYNATAMQHGSFLDAKIMSSSPSANYYRPTEEPEPLDLTQLNIEASVMCLVSKIKFLCGRCGSPAIRLRHPKPNMKRTGFQHSPAPPDLVASQNKVAEIGDSDMVSAVDEQTNDNGLNLDLTQNVEALEQCKEQDRSSKTDIEGIVPSKKGNKFTDG